MVVEAQVAVILVHRAQVLLADVERSRATDAVYSGLEPRREADSTR